VEKPATREQAPVRVMADRAEKLQRMAEASPGGARAIAARAMAAAELAGLRAAEAPLVEARALVVAKGIEAELPQREAKPPADRQWVEASEVRFLLAGEREMGGRNLGERAGAIGVVRAA
jgi:hypothetical protein